MSSTPPASRRRTFDLPKSSPDAGLAEWTSKIKAIQQEVDRDEEAEQRRLQEEITRSRMDRAKRRNTATGSIDWSKRAASPSNEAPNDTSTVVDKQQHHSDALRRLSRPTSPTRSPLGVPAPSVSSPVASGPKPEGVSLAAFMGGRATGPRLNKPAPQQDAHDPTKFDQTRHEGPHPVFGRPNDALSSRGRFPSPSAPKDVQVDSGQREEQRDQSDSKSSEPKVPLVSPMSDASSVRTAPAGVAKPTPEIPAKPLIYRKPSNKDIPAPEMTQDAGPSTLVRTSPEISTKPMYRPQPQQQGSSADEVPRRLPSVPVPPKPISLAEMMGGRASGPRLNKQPSREGGDPSNTPPSSRPPWAQLGRALPGLADTSPSNSSPSWASRTASTSPKPMPSRSSSQQAPHSDNTSPNPISPQKRSFSGSAVLLAGPVQPQVVVQPSPIAAASTAASPAFLRAPPSTQELHPSLSRLKGRGFVEQRVKATSELFGGSGSQQRERSISSGSPGKRATVLDRWQPTVTSPSSPPPISTPKKSSNKGESVEVTPPSSQSISVPQPVRPRTTSPGLVKPRAFQVEEVKQEVAAPVRLPGMAMSSFPPKQLVHGAPAEGAGTSHNRGVIENGTAENGRDKLGSTAPLNHPTRDRARKPRKAQGPSKTMPPARPLKQLTPEPDAKAEVPLISLGQHTSGVLPAGSVDRTTGPPRPQRIPSPEARLQPSPSAESEINRLKEALTYEPLIGIKPVVAGDQLSDTRPTNGTNPALGAGRRALPGMAAPSSVPSIVARPITPPSPTSSPEVPSSPMSPSRHSRIPSTGQRATVMDVAQALQEHEQHIRESSLTPEPDSIEEPGAMAQADDEGDETPGTDVKTAIASWGRNLNTGAQQAERRRSTYERYSIITLPPLLEEKTPAATPQASLSRGFTQVEQSLPHVQEIHQSLKDLRSPEADSGTVVSVVVDAAPDQEVHTADGEPKPAPEENLVHLEYQDRPPPPFNLQSILRETPYSPKSNSQTISVEVLTISGHTATAITREPNVFYESEVVAVVHRAKEKTGGLVSSKVWVWRGKNTEFTQREERKVHELAERFGTTETQCVQGSEPPELIHVLGGVLAIRQGIRVHWTVENTAMHRINRVGDSIFVDQVDLVISNLCSAYSYCISVLDALYVWHGRGASEDERKVASAYAQSLATESMSISEFEEGTEDEMFWMMLGDDSFANADHWKFKTQLDRLGSKLYAIDSTKPKAPVQHIPNLSSLDLPDDGVYVIDCRLELFILIAPQARGNRMDIQLGLFLAENISAAEATKRPFDPPIHVVILPSKLPLELKAAIRLCDEEKLNGGLVPEHMNLLTLSEALDHMQRRSWPQSTLSDPNFLPLGVHSRMF